MTTSSVRVALRVRPLSEQEQNNVISFIPNNQQQIVLNGDRSFTFDYVYPPSSDQNDVYSTCVVPLLNKFIEGYNATILAYGQTGSGKTHSMGIGLDNIMKMSMNDHGIVPRFIHALFNHLQTKQSPHYSSQVSVSFLELHNEDLVDLLCPVRKREGLNLTIREDSHGNICWSGVREEVVANATELLEILQKGSIARTTASTDMNHTSSRSHAIFSVVLKQFLQQDTTDDESTLHSDMEISQTPIEKKLVSKFHFVDLAGSERLKRTNAVGDRAKEGISINTGLLALGNVISALGDESRRVSHVPYRDSKLTRLLQDSLGGNSQTLMLACASPASANLTETLNTLKYANRARNIRNRVAINHQQDNNNNKKEERLKATITRLKQELKSTDDFLRAVNDEMDSLKTQVGSLQQTLDQTVCELTQVKYERDSLKHQWMQATGQTEVEIQDDHIVKEYMSTIESLKAELYQTQQKLLQKNVALQIDHIDSSSTLVGSPCQSPYLEQPPDKKRKKQHRVSSKRSKIVMRKSAVPSVNNSATDAEYLQFAKFANSSNETWEEKYKRHTIPSQENNKRILQKLASAIESKHQLLHQFEKSEKRHVDQIKQLGRTVNDLVAKKTASTQHLKRELNELRTQYEARLKKQQGEQVALRRKHLQLIRSSDRLRLQQESIIDQCHRTIEKLGHEKKKLLKRIKIEADRAKEKAMQSEQEIKKMKRQEAQAVTLKKRLERELGQQKAACKRATEEIVALSGQMKQIAAILKKVMASSIALSQRNLLAKAIACASVRGYLVKQNAVKKAGGKFQVTTLQQNVYQKKKFIHKALSLYVRGQCSSHPMIRELVQKRDRLLAEQKELLSERQLVLLEDQEAMDSTEPQYMDERIDLITVELDTLNQHIDRLTTPLLEHVEQENEVNWIDDQMDQQVAYELALSLIRSLEPEEARLISEALLEDVIALKTDYLAHSSSMHHLNSVVHILQTALVQMRRASNQSAVFMTTLQSPVRTQYGLVLPE
ncbi:P-loop containing nucleoside triphosphate hydrolase protein [Gilbertella persicaria]|uniref:P-loop containing nucleoside triphosphate hydrolase protein n=1 Tax=Gilbertella persicaria TaxID=101096 RepID=UPI00221F492F|nr:P-loop containing nucleoside triphosphate hydrolase protein [Gilbertella persicaria]KAI8073470.1 P-loop containing nucleoside triphosphate hydrolase protein [Gilbertella persicaria]